MVVFAQTEKRALAIRLIASGQWRSGRWTALSQIVNNECLGLLPDGGLVSRPKPVPPKKQILTLGEAAAVAGVHPVTIRRWIKAGRLTTLGTTPTLCIRREDLEELLSAGTRAR